MWWHGFPSKGGGATEVKDAILFMIDFSTFVVALLTYITNNFKKK
ncbi:putative holin-like toxin [Paenibacillus chartarius]|uniref:Holin-like toxin n=1 Tax=Paenibacillus chartarius TaxID=747481 RepID=A0ABV6DSB6_9BACL